MVDKFVRLGWLLIGVVLLGYLGALLSYGKDYLEASILLQLKEVQIKEGYYELEKWRFENEFLPYREEETT